MHKQLIAAAAALAAAFALPAQAITFEGAITQGASVVADYASTGEISFDIDFANLAPATLEYRLDDDDLNMPVTLSAVLRNLAGSGFDGYLITLGKGSFDTPGSVTRSFGGSTQVSTSGSSATLAFSSPEYLDIELGNALGTTPGAFDWTLTGLQSGDRVSITVTAIAAVPEPASVALLLAGLAGVGLAARRR